MRIPYWIIIPVCIWLLVVNYSEVKEGWIEIKQDWRSLWNPDFYRDLRKKLVGIYGRDKIKEIESVHDVGIQPLRMALALQKLQERYGVEPSRDFRESLEWLEQSGLETIEEKRSDSGSRSGWKRSIGLGL